MRPSPKLPPRSELRRMGLRLGFMGTPQAAVPTLEALAGSEHELAGVVTAPDRPRGRGLRLGSSPVKQKAGELGIPVLQPATLRNPGAQEALGGLLAEIFVVVGYGAILPPAVLRMAPLGCINVHFSLLPALRGAAPVQWAILRGLDMTGVSIIQLDEGLDTGPVLAQVEEPVAPADTSASLGERLSGLGAALCLDVLAAIAGGTASAKPQDHRAATLAPKITTEDARLDWSRTAGEIESKVRALNPKPGAWTTAGSRRLKVWRAEVSGSSSGSPPGTVRESPGTMAVATGTSDVILHEVQAEGARRMSASEFLRGRGALSTGVLV